MQLLNKLKHREEDKKMNTKYNYLDLEIKKVENVNISLNETINSYMRFIDELDTKEELMSTLLDFLIATRSQMNVLYLAVEDLKGFNNTMLLNSANNPDEQIDIVADNKFKRECIKFRY